MESPEDLKKTVNLPRTDFSMKANLPTLEPRLLAKWASSDVYGRIREARAGARSTSCTMDRRTPTATFTWDTRFRRR